MVNPWYLLSFLVILFLSFQFGHESLTVGNGTNGTVESKDWAIPTLEKKLRIGVPVKKGFKEFVKIYRNPHTNKTTYEGFSIDVFHAVLDALPFRVPHDFIPFMNDDGKSAGTYDDLLGQIYNKSFDAVVGDTTIVAHRTSWVDFTLPYSESRVSMVVRLKHDKHKNMRIFLNLLSFDLWLAIALASIFKRLVIRILEHRVNREFEGPPQQQLGMIFPQREMVVNYSRFVLVIWLFLEFTVMQSYMESLSSMLTVHQLRPTVVDVKELIRKGYNVGFQDHSFVKDFLVKHLNFDESKLKAYSTIEEYDEALSKGSHNGGVAAIFDEIPYIKLFLKRHGSKYVMIGPTYKTDGFGFAFPIDSPLVSHVSRAILKVTQGKKVNELETKYFGHKATSRCPSAPISAYSLRGYNFRGLFIFTGIAIFLALSFFGSFWLKTILGFLTRMMEMFL